MTQSGRLSTKEIYGYALGELGANMSWNMCSGFILFYYSNVALLPVAAVGTLLLLTRVFDALIDPLIGIAVDRTRTRAGRARPWVLAGIIPFGIVTCLTFHVPDWSVSAKLIYAYVTFTLAGICYSAVYIPYNALLPLMTSDAGDKMRIGGLRAMAASGGSIIVYGGMIPLVTLFGQGNQQSGFTSASLLMVAGTIVSLLVTYWVCRERPQPMERDNGEALVFSLRTMMRNRIWLIVAGFALAMFIRLGSLVSVTAYYANDVLGSGWAIGPLLSSLSVSLLIGGAVSKPYIGWLGKRRGNIIALIASILLTIASSFARQNVWEFGVLYGLGNITLGLQSATIFVLIADAVDEQEALCGSRTEGLLTSSISFAMKVGMAIGGSVIAFGLALASYDPLAVSEPARLSISALYFGCPVAFALLQILLISLLSNKPGPELHPYSQSKGVAT